MDYYLANGDLEEDKIPKILADAIDDVPEILKLSSPWKEQVLKEKDFDDEEIKSLDAAKDFGLF